LIFIPLLLSGCGKSGTPLIVEFSGTGTISGSFAKIENKTYSTGELASSLPQTITSTLSDSSDQLTGIGTLMSTGQLTIKCKKGDTVVDTVTTSEKFKMLTCTAK
jgi:hypothetical protein